MCKILRQMSYFCLFHATNFSLMKDSLCVWTPDLSIIRREDHFLLSQASNQWVGVMSDGISQEQTEDYQVRLLM